jgi:hypothetical protein
MNTKAFSIRRVSKILHQCCEDYKLDLEGLFILTEAATGAYLYTPILSALAGASMVFAVAGDSPFGAKEDVRDMTLEAARKFGVGAEVQVVFRKDKEIVEKCDILTNTGFVRPINRKMISWLKPTAVIPLMWETWEFREADLDLGACRDYGILVMGTSEEKAPLAMYGYTGFLAMKLLFELGLEGYKTKVLLLGGKEGLGFSIYNHFKQIGIETTWFANSETDSSPYTQLANHFLENGAKYDGIIVAEHADNIMLLGEDGLLTYKQLKEANPAICVGVIAGNLDIDGLKNSGLSFFPRDIYPFGYISYQPYSLGPRPVLELFAAGLKVGEVMARCRLQGMNIEETKQHAMHNSLAMDF